MARRIGVSGWVSPRYTRSASVVEQLRRTLTFKSYRYVTTLSQHTVDFWACGRTGSHREFLSFEADQQTGFLSRNHGRGRRG